MGESWSPCSPSLLSSSTSPTSSRLSPRRCSPLAAAGTTSSPLLPSTPTRSASSALPSARSSASSPCRSAHTRALSRAARATKRLNPRHQHGCHHVIGSGPPSVLDELWDVQGGEKQSLGFEALALPQYKNCKSSLLRHCFEISRVPILIHLPDGSTSIQKLQTKK